MGRTVLLMICTMMIFVVACSGSAGVAVSTQTPSPQPSTATPRASPTLIATRTPTRELKTTVICFSRISFPEDEEGIRTQIGPRVGIVSLIVEMNNTMTVVYDPTLTSREQIVLAARNLGFSVLDEPCP